MNILKAKELYASLKIKTKKINIETQLTYKLTSELINIFMPVGTSNCKKKECTLALCQSRCSDEYWIDHGLVTQMLMKSLAKKIGKDENLYGFVGLIHDIDYLEYPHDMGETKHPHPVPLVTHLDKIGVHPVICLAILEHAAYLGLYKEPTSRLSASLSACEDLATLISIGKNKDALAELSHEAQELSQGIYPNKLIDVEIEKPRVLDNIDVFINKPLALALNKQEKFTYIL